MSYGILVKLKTGLDVLELSGLRGARQVAKAYARDQADMIDNLLAWASSAQLQKVTATNPGGQRSGIDIAAVSRRAQSLHVARSHHLVLTVRQPSVADRASASSSAVVAL
jgi:hypothetical protein